MLTFSQTAASNITFSLSFFAVFNA